MTETTTKADWELEAEKRKQTILQLLIQHDILVTSRFVPFSQSRYKDNKDACLNWIITLRKGEREVLTTDYMAGQAHCPGYKAKGIGPRDRQELTNWECEHGRRGRYQSWGVGGTFKREEIKPDPLDVVHCLLLDSDVIDYIFKDWCSNYGYSDDSIAAKQIYDACMTTAIQLRAGLGEKLLAELKEAYDGY